MSVQYVNKLPLCLCMTLLGGSAWHQHKRIGTASLGEGWTSDNEEPGEAGRQVLLHLIVEVACESSLQLDDGGNQEGYPQDSNSAAGLTYAFIPMMPPCKSSVQRHATSGVMNGRCGWRKVEVK